MLKRLVCYPKNNKMKILVAEDQTLVLAAMAKLLLSIGFIKKVEEAKDGREAIEKAKTFDPDVFLLDYEMPNYNATYATRIIKSKWPETPVLIMTMYQSEDSVMEVVNAGANGIVFKDAKVEDITDAIRVVADGGNWFKGKVAEILAQRLMVKDNGCSNELLKDSILPKKLLTKRELEMINYFVMGHTSAEIADMLFISKRTVDSHKTNIFKKLGVNNCVRLAKFAIENKLTG